MKERKNKNYYAMRKNKLQDHINRVYALADYYEKLRNQPVTKKENEYIEENV